MLARLVVIAAIVWPLVAGGALWVRVSAADNASVASGGVAMAGVVYLAAAQICHQRPERSFSTGGVSWPVCARCAGLYVAAPFAAVFTFLGWPGRWAKSRTLGATPWRMVAVAAIPTALTLAWEWGGFGMPAHAWRFTTALLLGAAVTSVLVRTASEGAGPARSPW